MPPRQVYQSGDRANTNIRGGRVGRERGKQRRQYSEQSSSGGEFDWNQKFEFSRPMQPNYSFEQSLGSSWPTLEQAQNKNAESAT